MELVQASRDLEALKDRIEAKLGNRVVVRADMGMVILFGSTEKYSYEFRAGRPDPAGGHQGALYLIKPGAAWMNSPDQIPSNLRKAKSVAVEFASLHSGMMELLRLQGEHTRIARKYGY